MYKNRDYVLVTDTLMAFICRWSLQQVLTL